MAHFDIYEAVTSRIIAELEKGVIPWEKPWTGIAGGAVSGSTGKPYSLLNQMLLGKPGEYFTFKQVVQSGGHVRKGEKASFVVFWKQIVVKENTPDGNPIERLIPVLKYYNVFHSDQCEGLKQKTLTHEPAAPVPIANAEAIIKQYAQTQSLIIEHQRGDEAYYSPARDCIVVPLREQFQTASEYYGTLFHEAAHSTGHRSRLNRIKTTAHFGNSDYSKEELVAEISAAALLNYIGAETKQSLRNSAAYIQSWLTALKNDKRMIVSASGHATKAVQFILGEQVLHSEAAYA